MANAVSYAPPPPPPRTPDTIDSVVASVDGTPITSQDLKTFGADKSAISDPNEPVPSDPKAQLKALITQQLVEQESQKYAGKVDDDDIDAFIQKIEERNHMTDEQLRSQLQSQGATYAEFRQSVRRQIESMTMFQDEMRDKIAISPQEIETYYKEHPEEFTVTEERYRLAQILIAAPAGATPQQVDAAKRKAHEVHDQLVKGKDFGDMARQYSDDDSKTKGGELGEFDPADLNDDIAAGIKNVKVGDVSDVIRTKYGFHIIKVEAHQAPGPVPLAEVKAAIRDKLQGDRSKETFQDWVDHDLVKEHYVETSE